MIKRKELRN